MKNGILTGMVMVLCVVSLGYAQGRDGDLHGAIDVTYLSKYIWRFMNGCTVKRNTSYKEGGGIAATGRVELAACSIVGNSAATTGGGIHIYNIYSYNRAVLKSCVLSANTAGEKGGAIYSEQYSNVMFDSCTLATNSAGSTGESVYNDSTEFVATNCIFWGSHDSTGSSESGQIDGIAPDISFSCIQDEDAHDVNIPFGGAANGNIDDDPCFAQVGHWIHIDDPNIPVEPNDPNAVLVEGDYHLKSEYGRWDPNGNAWVYDAATSLCIDAGDPNAEWKGELWPHGKRVNMGAYGGTIQASMSPNDVGKIADIDLDGFIYRSDLPLLMDAWLSDVVPLREDLTRDGIVAFPDFAVFASNFKQPPLPAQAQILTPLDGEVGVGRAPVLSWISDANALWHDVYLGTESPGLFQGRISTTTFLPEALSKNTWYYWRIDEVNPTGTTTSQVWSFQTGSSPDPATIPYPPDDSTEVPNTLLFLAWTPGDGAESHDVYFGPTNPPQFQKNQTAPFFVTDYLEHETTYYWRIDEVNALGTTRGTVWSFTTEDLF